jgi:TonB family protein
LSLEGKIGLATLVVAILAFFASFVVPEVRYILHLEKRPEERMAQPTPAQPAPHEEEPKPKAEPPQEATPKESAPGAPDIRYVPLPNAAPLKTPGTLVTSAPREGGGKQTVSINGETIPVMTQEDLDKVLSHKVYPAFTYRQNPSSGRIDLFVAIGKDGTVQDVQVVSGDKDAAEEAKKAVKQWRFKPFIKDGEQVAVQTVIQFEPKNSEKP